MAAGGVFCFRGTHRVKLPLGAHVGVIVAPVEGQLLLLSFVESDQLLGAARHEAVQALQTPQAPRRLFLQQPSTTHGQGTLLVLLFLLLVRRQDGRGFVIV